MQNSKLHLCIKIEVEVSRIYKLLIEYFPEFQDIWRKLSAEEENHATILDLAKEYKSAELINEVIANQNMSELQECLALINELDERISNHTISIEELLDKLIGLENSMAENFLQESMTKKEGSETFLKLKKVYLTEEHHAKMLERLKNRLNKIRT